MSLLKKIHSIRKNHSVWAMVTAVSIFGAKVVFLLSSSVRGLGLTPWIIDDSFIEMAVSRNIALGKGFSYDWIHATTGSPPLWTYLISFNHTIFAKDLAIKFTLIESGFFGMLAALLVFFIAYRISKRYDIAWIAFLLSLLTGNAFFEAINGMDTSLFTFAVIGSVAAYIGVWTSAKNFWWGAHIGAWAGLALLVRGDGIFIAFALGCLLLWDRQKTDKAHRHWHGLAGFATVSLLCFVAVIGWQTIRTGSPFLANQVGRHELALALHSFSYTQFSLSHYIRIVIWNVFQLEKLLTIALGSTLLALTALVYSSRQKEYRHFNALLSLYALSFFGMLIAYQWYFPDMHGLRYINPGVHLLFICMAYLFATILDKKPYRQIAATTLTIGTILLSWNMFRDMIHEAKWSQGTSFTATPTSDEEKNGWAAIDWIVAHTPKDAIIGVRDHGRMALFTERPIQDLAGNIDPNVPQHVKNGTLKEYLRSRNVSYLFIPTLEFRKDPLYQEIYKENMPMTKVPNAPELNHNVLYKLDWTKN